MDSVGEGEGGKIWENGIETCETSWAKVFTVASAIKQICQVEGLPWWLRLKESACNVGDLGSIPGLGRSPGGGHGNLLQYSCLENPCG